MQLQHQSADKPLFPDMLWSKPENKKLAGKLLVVGGNSFGFSAVGEAYEHARKNRVGEVRVLLPDVIQKFAGGVFEHALFAPSNPSGSFAKEALPVLIDAAGWADGVLVIGDVSRNAEAAALLEEFSRKYQGILTISGDALETLLKQSDDILKRPDTDLVMTMANLQLAAKTLGFTEPLTFESPTDLFAKRLERFTAETKANIVVKRRNGVFVAADKRLSVTEVSNERELWRNETATKAAIWHLQNPNKPFEALTSGLIMNPE
ncbi:MAG: hypothetical protein U5L95_03920 [Candidatus Saccharibacteria bacterium]|nr:hypothetical protein [Candidatus Saccharibacteria bacterium]